MKGIFYALIKHFPPFSVRWKFLFGRGMHAISDFSVLSGNEFREYSIFHDADVEGGNEAGADDEVAKLYP